MKTKIIAEIGINHNGLVDLGYKLIDAASNAGVSSIKFQTYNPDLRFNPGNPFIETFRQYNLSYDDEFKLWEYAKSIGLEVLTTPFDNTAVDFCLAKKNLLSGVKIASFETTNKKLVREVSSLKLPTYFSTGQNSLEEVINVVKILETAGVKQIIPMHCISSYPMKLEDANLMVINKLKNKFGKNIGFSDHSEGHEAAGYAVAMGAICIEKHFTLDKKMDGPDHSFSLNPEELKLLVKHVKFVESLLGNDWMGVRKSEENINKLARREVD